MQVMTSANQGIVEQRQSWGIQWGAWMGKSMVNEKREHVGNLPVNVFPISAGGGRGQKEHFIWRDEEKSVNKPGYSKDTMK